MFSALISLLFFGSVFRVAHVFSNLCLFSSRISISYFMTLIISIVLNSRLEFGILKRYLLIDFFIVICRIKVCINNKACISIYGKSATTTTKRIATVVTE